MSITINRSNGVAFAVYSFLVAIYLMIPQCGKSQVVIIPAAQINFFEQSIGFMAGYKVQQVSFLFNYQKGHSYEEKSAVITIDFTDNPVFDVGLSFKTGMINNHFGIWYPGLEQEYHLNKHSSIQLGIRPSNYGLLIIEPRYCYKFW